MFFSLTPGRPRALQNTALASPLVVLGGVAGLQALVQRFLQLMDELALTQARPELSPPQRQDRQERLFEFLSGSLGGPSLYANQQTPPRMRLRHAPTVAGALVHDEWRLCMTQALCDQVTDRVLLASLMDMMDLLADHLLNVSSRPLTLEP